MMGKLFAMRERVVLYFPQQPVWCGLAETEQKEGTMKVLKRCASGVEAFAKKSGSEVA